MRERSQDVRHDDWNLAAENPAGLGAAEPPHLLPFPSPSTHLVSLRHFSEHQSVEAALKMIPDVLVRCMTIMAPAWILSGIREAGSKPMSSYLSCTDGCKDPDAPQMIFRFGKAIEQSGTHR